jgi:hypothetical protein
VVEAICGDFYVIQRDRLEGHILREELANETVPVLVGTAFPRGIGMSEEEVSTEFLGDPLMLGELFAVVGRYRVNTGRKRRQQRDHGVGDRLRRLERHVGNQRIARSAFIQCNERLLLTCANHQITLPVAEAAPLSHNDGTQIDGHLVGNRAAPFASAVALPARLLAAQSAMQGAAGTLVGIATPIDGLVADGGLFVGFEVSNEDIGFVRQGLPVKLKFAAFPFQKYGMVEGTVEHVSADSADGNAGNGNTPGDKAPAKNQPMLYKALVTLKAMRLEMDGEKFPLSAGMQSSAEILLGTRTVAEYLLSPVRKAWHEAGRER